jgi:hypothetical protein
MKHSVDFRRIYASLLQQWMGLDILETAEILDGEFNTLPLISM